MAAHSLEKLEKRQAKPEPAPSRWSAPLLSREELTVIGCALGIYTCYLKYGVLQEKIYKRAYGLEGEHFTMSIFLVLIQCAVNALFAFAAVPFSEHKPNTVPPRQYAVVAFFYISAMLASFHALHHMSYPMQALGKSCKMIPVMLIGMVVRGKRYSTRDFLCVLLITSGVVLFSLSRPSKGGGGHTEPMGVFLLFVSLLMDGLTGAFQEKLVSDHKPTTHQLMGYQNAWSVLLLLAGSLVTGELTAGTAFVMRHPEAMRDILMFGLMSALGQNFIFYTVRNVSALACTTITTTRKFFTILISVLTYGHSLMATQWLAVAMVFSGIVWETVAKHQQKSKKKVEGENIKKGKKGDEAELEKKDN